MHTHIENIGVTGVHSLFYFGVKIRVVLDGLLNWVDILITRKQSELAHLRQGNVVRQVAAPSSVLQRFPLRPIGSNGNENFKVIQNPGFLLDHPQN